MADREVRVKLSMDAAGLRQAAQGATRDLQGLARQGAQVGDGVVQGTQRMSGSISGSLVKVAALTGGIAAVGSASSSVLKSGAQFETNIALIGATSNASAQQLQSVADTARQLGNDIDLPAASAVDAAAAMLELTKGGLSVTESMDAAKGTLQLAAAAAIDGAAAAGIQANALNTFGLEADQASRVADVLANTANAASGEIGDFALGLAQSGGVARQFGVSLEDTAATLAIFSANGVQGSDAGTSLKTMLLSLTDTSDKAQAAMDTLGVRVYDAAGNFVGLRAVTDQLSQAKARLTQEEFNAAAGVLFGSDAIRAANFLAAGGVAQFDQYSAAVGRVGGAADLAGAQTEGLTGALGLVRNALETAGLELFEQLGDDVDATVRQLAADIPQLATSIAPAVAGLGEGLLDTVDAIQPLVLALAAALGPAFSAAGSVISAFTPVLEPLITVLAEVLGWVSDIPGPVLVAVAAFATWAAVGPKVLAFLAAIPAKAAAAGGSMAAAFGPVGLAITAAVTALAFFGSAQDDAAQKTRAHQTAVDGLAGALERSNGVIDETVRAEALAQLKTAEWGRESNDLRSYADNLGVSLSTLVDGMLGVGTASDDIASSYEKQSVALQSVIDAGTEYNEGGIFQTAEAVAAQKKLDILNEQQVAYGNLLGIQDKARAQAEQEALAVEGAGVAYDRVGRTVDEYGISLGTTGKAATETGEAAAASQGQVGSFAQSLKDTADAAKSASEQTDIFRLSLDQLQGKNVDAELANRKVAAAFREISAAARDRQDAEAGLVEAQEKLAELRSSDLAEGETQAQRNREIAATEREIAGARTDLIGLTDRQKQANSDAADAARDSTVATFNQSLAVQGQGTAVRAAVVEMGRRRQAFIAEQVASGVARTAAEKLADSYGLIPSAVKTEFDAITAEAKTKGETLYRVYDSTTGTWTGLFLTAGDATARQNAGETVQKYNQLDGTWSAKFEATPTNVANTEATLNSLARTRRAAIEVTTTATQIVNQIIRNVAGADGMLLDFYAAGGLRENHVAQIAPAGTWRVWAEDETGGEGYIPLALSKRARSEQIMAEIARRFDGEYIPGGKNFAAGGLLNVQKFADGGLPSVRNLAGIADPSFSGRLAVTIAALADAADVVREAAAEAAAALADQRQKQQALAAAQNELSHLSRTASAEERKSAIERRDNAQKELRLSVRARESADRHAGALERTQKAQGGIARALLRETARADRFEAQRDVATSRLADVRQARAQLRSSVSDTVAGFGGGITGNADTRNTFATLLKGQQFNLAQQRGFAGNLAKLSGLGLDKSLLAEIAGKGVDANGTALALLQGGKAGIGQINAIQAQMRKVADAAGSTAGSAMFAAGESAAEGLVRGLQRNIAATEGAARRLAEAANRGLTRALRIRSPSVVFDEHGRNIAAGLTRGIQSGAPAVSQATANLVQIPTQQQFVKQASTAGAPQLVLGPGSVRVFVGNQEIRDITRVEVASGVQQLTGALRKVAGQPQAVAR